MMLAIKHLLSTESQTDYTKYYSIYTDNYLFCKFNL